MKTIETVANQTVFDIAVKYYGNAQAVGEIIDNNPDLRNDPQALAALGIDYLSDDGFYIDVALSTAQTIKVDTDSELLKQSVVKELKNKEINTFDL